MGKCEGKKWQKPSNSGRSCTLLKTQKPFLPFLINKSGKCFRINRSLVQKINHMKGCTLARCTLLYTKTFARKFRRLESVSESISVFSESISVWPKIHERMHFACALSIFFLLPHKSFCSQIIGA